MRNRSHLWHPRVCPSLTAKPWHSADENKTIRQIINNREGHSMTMTDHGHSVILSERRQNMNTVQTADGQIPLYHTIVTVSLWFSFLLGKFYQCPMIPHGVFSLHYSEEYSKLINYKCVSGDIQCL